jgi:hypothetical protein
MQPTSTDDKDVFEDAHLHPVMRKITAALQSRFSVAEVSLVRGTGFQGRGVCVTLRAKRPSYVNEGDGAWAVEIISNMLFLRKRYLPADVQDYLMIDNATVYSDKDYPQLMHITFCALGVAE